MKWRSRKGNLPRRASCSPMRLEWILRSPLGGQLYDLGIALLVLGLLLHTKLLLFFGCKLFLIFGKPLLKLEAQF
jgi:hypothetical protein